MNHKDNLLNFLKGHVKNKKKLMNLLIALINFQLNFLI